MTSPSCFSTPVPLHGGPDAAGVPVFDFSTNSNACGPCPEALHAVQSADATRYPDPAYTALRAALTLALPSPDSGWRLVTTVPHPVPLGSSG